MKNKILKIYKEQKSVILYLFFGGCTTLINIVCYFCFYRILGVSNFMSTVIAWVVGVLFAFVTNSKYVFESKAAGYKEKLYEMASFYGCRLMTGVMDVAIMLIAVDWMGWHDLLWKVISNVLGIIINYVASKYVIFKDKS